MARRKSKAKQEEEFVQAIAGIVLVGSFFGTMFLTKSMTAAFIVAGIAFAVMVAVMIMIGMNRMDKLRRSGISDIDKMDGRQFEIYLGELFKKHGYQVNVTRAAGDYGADLVIAKNGIKIVVQAKRYSKNVGIDAVQAVQASIKHYGATEGWVVSNRDYTEAAYTLAKSNGIKLINREELIAMILKMNPGVAPKPKQIIQTNPGTQKVCNKCGSQMVIRKSTKGEFLGCSSFPKCRNMQQIS